jgi:hypothetical protein
MNPPEPNGALLPYLRSIDERLSRVEQKLDGIGDLRTKFYAVVALLVGSGVLTAGMVGWFK